MNAKISHILRIWRAHNEKLSRKIVERALEAITEFMEWLRADEVPNDYIFSQAEKAAVTPNDIHRYFCWQAFGKENPLPTDNPIYM